MKLLKNLECGSLLYLRHNIDTVCVSENEHYRWLNIGDVCQSIMLKRCPYKLVLPHQYAMMMPLLFYKPRNICEIGLGAGTFARFIDKFLPNSSLTSIEADTRVIESFYQYFPGDLTNHKVVNEFFDVETNSIVKTGIDWWLYDLYSSTDNNKDCIDNLSSFLSHTSNKSLISVNITNACEKTINCFLTLFKEYLDQYSVFYFEIPQYSNIIVIALPRDDKQSSESALPKSYQIRWHRLWKTGIKLM
jgi:spermidine synthase